MLLRLYLPLMVFLILQSLSLMESLADSMLDDFESAYRGTVCARADVHRRNLEDGFLYLKARFPYLEPISAEASPEGCAATDFAVYREINPKLPLVYPNWLSLEAMPREEGAIHGR